jgi:hypothetical protein
MPHPHRRERKIGVWKKQIDAFTVPDEFTRELERLRAERTDLEARRAKVPPGDKVPSWIGGMLEVHLPSRFRILRATWNRRYRNVPFPGERDRFWDA